METYIELENVRFHAFHGVMPQERKVGNEFEVSVRIKYDFSQAALTDDLTNTINYALVYDILKQEMMIPSELIEHAAGRMVNKLKATWPTIAAIELKLSKLNPPIVGDVAKASVIIKI